MKIYNYHPITKEFLDESSADIDPLESEKQKKEVYLVPSNSTRIQPPNVSENQVVCFINDNWVIKSDFRGQTYYDKETREAVIIDFIGNIPDNLIKKLSPYVPTLDEFKAKDNISAENRIKDGITYNNVKYDIDNTAMNNMSFIEKLLSRGKCIDIVLKANGTIDIENINIRDYESGDTFQYIDYDYKPVSISDTDFNNIYDLTILTRAKIFAKNAQNQTAESLTEQDVNYSNL